MPTDRFITGLALGAGGSWRFGRPVDIARTRFQQLVVARDDR